MRILIAEDDTLSRRLLQSQIQCDSANDVRAVAGDVTA